MSVTALASSIQPLWTLLEEYGQDPEPLFRKSGIDPVLLKNPNARLPVPACNAAWLRASGRIADPCFGVKAGLHWHPSMFGALATPGSRARACAPRSGDWRATRISFSSAGRSRSGTVAGGT